MLELQKIILDLQRDVKRVSSAISPLGAETMVAKHNKANPKSPWKLNKIDPSQPASLHNLTDINNDGIPDVIISNANNYPMYVNGYTTKRSDYPIRLNYYNEYPTRKSRKGYPISEYKKDIWNPEYVDSGDDFKAYGNVDFSFPNQLKGYNIKGYSVKEPKRMSSYSRYRKFVVGPIVDKLINQLSNNHVFIPKAYKLQLLASATARTWENNLDTLFYQKYNATTKDAQTKIKKQFKDEIDNWVSELISRIQNEDDDLIEQIGSDLGHALHDVAQEFEENQGINLREVYLAEKQAEQLNKIQAQAIYSSLMKKKND